MESSFDSLLRLPSDRYNNIEMTEDDGNFASDDPLEDMEQVRIKATIDEILGNSLEVHGDEAEKTSRTLLHSQPTEVNSDVKGAFNIKKLWAKNSADDHTSVAKGSEESMSELNGAAAHNLDHSAMMPLSPTTNASIRDGSEHSFSEHHNISFSQENSTISSSLDEATDSPSPKKRRGRPPSGSKSNSSPMKRPAREEVYNPPNSLPEGWLVPSGSKSNSSPMKRPAVEEEYNPSNSLPEGWLFCGVKRLVGSGRGKFDQYYWTAPPRRAKLRSRLDILRFMEKRNQPCDVQKFFMTPTLLNDYVKKGVLVEFCEGRLVTFAGVWKRMTLEEFMAATGLRTSRRKPNLPPDEVDKADKGDKHLNKNKPVFKKSPTKPKLVKSRRSVEVPKASPVKSPTLSKRRTRLGTTFDDSGALKPRLTSESNFLGDSDDSEDTREVYVPRKTRSEVKQVTPVHIKPIPAATTKEENVRIRSKPKVVKSPYFAFKTGLPDKPISFGGIRKERDGTDVPPRSPFNLIQEDLFHDPWQMLVASIFLNCTSGKLAVPLATEFLSRWPTPQEACMANVYDILDLVEPIGFGRIRAAQLIRFSYEFLLKDWKYPIELYGVGKYGNDSYKIFCLKNEWKRVDTDDPMLMMYLNWRRATEHLRKKFSKSPGDPSVVDPDDLPVHLQETTVSTSNSSIKEKQANSPSETSHMARKRTSLRGVAKPSPKKRLRTRTANL